jgi:hypothetical protein
MNEMSQRQGSKKRTKMDQMNDFNKMKTLKEKTPVSKEMK